MRACVGRVIAILGVAAWLIVSGEAWAATRVALVVGNGEYGPEVGRLKNPGNDAQLMADTLTDLGFEVTLVRDADQKALKRAIREFGQKLRETGAHGIGLFYYAGHGVQVDGENYLLPIGAEIAAEGDVELEAVSATSILSQMQFAGNAINLVFLDACRNNPLTRSFRSGMRGLARVDAPRGSFVGYSTAPGDISVDGESDNSPYALALVEELTKPGISIEEAHRAVRGKVLAATGQRQTPWDSSSLTGPVILAEAKPAAEPQVAAVVPAPQPAPASTPAPSAAANQQAELLFWESIKDSNNPATFDAYLKQFPNGVFAGLAQAKLDELKPKAEPVAPVAPAETQSAQRQIQPAAPQPEPEPLEIQELAGTYVAAKSANVRAAPATDAKIIAKLSADQAVDATGLVAGGEWLRVSLKGKTGFVSSKLMVETDAEEVAAWSQLKAAPSEAGAQAFLAAHPSGYFRPKAQALLATLQAKKAAPVAAPAAAVAEAPQPMEPVAVAQPQPQPQPQPAPAATQQAAVTPQPAVNVVRISSALRKEVERYLRNSESFGGYYRFLAVNAAGDKIGVSNCRKMTTWMSDGCGGVGDPHEGAKRVALKNCGGTTECRLIFDGTKKIGSFEIEWY
ncbi:caspase family protein [Dongia deserti]|uniref:caspase family protein n=1 Tax=Dongia deserti TaxID=2268030 RepID=UPI0013C42D74|nr:caspase family protein [Dongia deserti]